MAMMPMDPGLAPAGGTPPPPPLEQSFTLARRAAEGDDQALNLILQRYHLRLGRWAHGRLPAGARSLIDTGDIVQDVCISVVRRLPSLEIRDSGSLILYMMQAVRNRIRDVGRGCLRRHYEEATPDLPSADPTPSRELESERFWERYQRALEKLDPEERLGFVLRAELKAGWEEIALEMGRPSKEAARVAVRRATIKLGRLLKDA